MRWAPILHSTLKWLPPAVGAACVAVAGLVVAAAQVNGTAERWVADAIGAVAPLTANSLAWAIVVLIFVIWLMAFVWSGHLAQGEAPTKAGTTSPSPRAPCFEDEDQRRLAAVLRDLAGLFPAAPIVSIEFGSDAEHALADRLDALFRAAGWVSDLNLTPQVPYKGGYPIGREVAGFNSFLVDAVAKALRESGIAGVRQSMITNALTGNTPKGADQQRRVRLNLGASGIVAA